jgi:Dyp-type peroxidase family
MTNPSNTALEFDDIQSGALRPRPSPYAATYIGLRIDDRKAGRDLMRRALGVVNSAADATSRTGDAWVSLAITCEGLKALGVPQASIDSLAPEFQRGMAARAAFLKDTGESGPEHWEKPLGTPDLHVILTALAPDQTRLDALLARGRAAYEGMPGIKAIWRQDCYALPTEKEHFGYKDGIGQPAIEGSDTPRSNPLEAPLKAGEFVVGYPDETGCVQVSVPEVLAKNGTYVGFRKLYQRVGAFRQYLKANATKPGEEELLAAKMMGRWRSGAPLALAPDKDDPELAADTKRHNAFLYKEDDPRGFKTPIESHLRRMNPRDAEVIGLPRIHRIFRRGTVYGPPLPEGVLEDDGVDRGFVFAFVGACPGRQFEFVQSQWLNDGEFAGAGAAKDPIAGDSDGAGTFTIPQRPIRRCMQGLPRFVVTRGGEYGFMPSLSALKWLGGLDT